MNLVAKEFVAARDDEDGVLVLSALAGAAQELRDALIINPYDIDGFAAALAHGDRHAARGAADAHARDAAHRRRPQRVQLGVGHPRGAREPLDQAAALCRARAGGCAGLASFGLDDQRLADTILAMTSSTPSPASPVVTSLACALSDGTAFATATPNPQASRNA